MHYTVVFVGDDKLPTENEWALVFTPVRTYAFIKESCVCAALLSEVWAAFMEALAGMDVGHRLSA